MEKPIAASRLDGYDPGSMSRDGTMSASEVIEAAEQAARIDVEDLNRRMDAGEVARWDTADMEGFRQVLFDAYRNRLTGLGDPNSDKTFGGRPGGPEFVLQLLSAWEAMDRWRGSDTGSTIVERIPTEMTRKGWKIDVQPEEGEFAPADISTMRADSAWSLVRKLLVRLGVRRDEWPAATTPAAPAHVPEQLPRLSEDGTAIVQAIVEEQTRLGLKSKLRLGLCYERNFGGAAVLIGVDDGNRPLTEPLNENNIRRIKHLTPFYGGWEGEITAWRWYNDPRHDKYGQPEIYMVRNIGVPIGGVPAPGEDPAAARRSIPDGPAASLVFFVHESRLLIFDGSPVSRWAQTQMRGWGDGIWPKIDRVLSQHDQTWSGISILMQEFALPIQSMEGLAKLMAMQNKEGMDIIGARLKMMQMSMSVAHVRLIDTKEKMERMSAPLGGAGEILNQMNLRLAATAGMPVSMLMGQVQGGLGDAAAGDIHFFYDRIEGEAEERVLPMVQLITRLQFLSKEGPTGGRLPKRYSVDMNPLSQMTDAEEAEYELNIAKKDDTYIKNGTLTPEEVAAKRFGGSRFDPGAVVLDMEGRRAAKDAEVNAAEQAAKAQPPTPVAAPDPNAPPSAQAVTPPRATNDAADFVKRNGRTKVSTAVSVVVAFNGDGKVLMGRRRDSGRLCFPGGHAEPGETSYCTAFREFFEETGLIPKAMDFVGRRRIGNTLTVTQVDVYRALVDGEPDGSQDPDQEFASFEWVELIRGNYPTEVREQLHHEKDVVGPVLRRGR